jgi:DNA-binding MarR family transcriptional regulator
MATARASCVASFEACRPRSVDREAWMLMVEIVRLSRGQLLASLAELGLAPVQAHALRLLRPGTTVTMRELARALACDASNVTGIVDRLERRGLVERRSAVHDRRVRTLELTPAGVEARRRVLARMHHAPPAIAGLSAEDQRELRDILRRALAAAAKLA